MRGTGNFGGVTSNDLDLNNQAAFGLKAGRFFHGGLRWLGLEFDFSHSDANIAEQGVTANAPILGVTHQNGRTPGVGLSVNHMTVNLIAHYLGSRMQPYIGIGGGLWPFTVTDHPSRRNRRVPGIQCTHWNESVYDEACRFLHRIQTCPRDR